MKNKLYLYTSDLVVDDNQSNRAEHLLDLWSDHDRQDQERITAILLQFAADNDLIVNNDGVLQPVIDKVTGSFAWSVTWMNLRSIVDIQNLNDLMSALHQNDGHPINQVIDLHVRLGVLFDARVLNTIVHRTMTSVNIIPYPVKLGNESSTWEQIHLVYPFIWLLILLQATIRSHTTPIK
jgi:hypothetical protein